MYNVARNNFYENEKDATVHTPPGVSQFIFDILGHKIDKNEYILYPCVGLGSLLYPFYKAGFDTKGIDIKNQGWPDTIEWNFLDIFSSPDYKELKNLGRPGLVLCNPPFNIDKNTREFAREQLGGRPLIPEAFLECITRAFGLNVPIVLFAPYGLRLNQTLESARWQRFLKHHYPEIQSIISLPKNVFKDVLFHSEILIFNVYGLKPHYFYDTPREVWGQYRGVNG